MTDIQTQNTQFNEASEAAAAEYVATLSVDDEFVDQLKTSMMEILAKHILPLVTENTAKTGKGKGKGKKKATGDKKSHRANHYAFFRQLCSTAKPSPLAVKADFSFSYRPELSELQEKAKRAKPTTRTQEAVYEELHADAELLEKFEAFNTTDLTEVVAFVDENFKEKEKPMVRTAVVWDQFMTADERNTFKEWFNAHSNEDGTFAADPPSITEWLADNADNETDTEESSSSKKMTVTVKK